VKTPLHLSTSEEEKFNWISNLFLKNLKKKRIQRKTTNDRGKMRKIVKL